MSDVEILGIPINGLRRAETLLVIEAAIGEGRRLTIATPNPEFLIQAHRDSSFEIRLRAVDLRIPDGVGLLWAAAYDRLPWRGTAWAWWQLLYSGASLIIFPPYCRRILTETVPGSWLVSELAREAAQKGWRIFLLGAGPGVAQKVAEEWTKQWPALEVRTSSADPGDDRALNEIRAFDPHLVLIAYTAPDQLTWIEKHPDISAVLIGIGGALDQIARAGTLQAGERAQRFRARPAPEFLQRFGLGWLWRLITQPWRVRRIVRAVPIFMKTVLQYKRHEHVNHS